MEKPYDDINSRLFLMNKKGLKAVIKVNSQFTSKGAETSSALVLAEIIPPSSSLQFLMISFLFFPSAMI
jgi:hypothetical protein